MKNLTPENLMAAQQAQMQVLEIQRNTALNEIARMAGELAIRDAEIAALRKELVAAHRAALEGEPPAPVDPPAPPSHMDSIAPQANGSAAKTQ